MLPAQLVQRRARVRPFADNHLVNNDSKTVDVRTTINLRISVSRQLAPLLRRHVMRSAEDLSGHRQRSFAGPISPSDLAHFRNSQVEQFHGALATGTADHNVVGFQITMNDTHRVCRIKHTHDRLQHFQSFQRCVTATSLDLFAQSLTLYILHHHVDGAVASCA